MWRYGMPQRAPEGCTVLGYGDGEYKAAAPIKAVVGVVGSAHVAGIVREWESAGNLDRLTELQSRE